MRAGAVIVTLTGAGRALGERLAALHPDSEHLHRPQSAAAAIQARFTAGRPLILVAATGIAVRILAPVLRGKHQDPPVLVLDEAGRFVIPLLSGHEGGANDWAARLAMALGAECVITTAGRYTGPIWVAGMGCERGCPKAELDALLEAGLEEAGVAAADLSALASLDLKADETGLRALADDYRLPFATYPAEALRSVEDRLSVSSDVVFREVGCYGVAEGAALHHAEQLTGASAVLALPKRKARRATLAIARVDTDNKDSL